MELNPLIEDSKLLLSFEEAGTSIDDGASDFPDSTGGGGAGGGGGALDGGGGPLDGWGALVLIFAYDDEVESKVEEELEDKEDLVYSL